MARPIHLLPLVYFLCAVGCTAAEGGEAGDVGSTDSSEEVGDGNGEEHRGITVGNGP